MGIEERVGDGMSTGCCMETNLSINFIYKKKEKIYLYKKKRRTPQA